MEPNSQSLVVWIHQITRYLTRRKTIWNKYLVYLWNFVKIQIFMWSLAASQSRIINVKPEISPTKCIPDQWPWPCNQLSLILSKLPDISFTSKPRKMADTFKQCTVSLWLQEILKQVLGTPPSGHKFNQS